MRRSRLLIAMVALSLGLTTPSAQAKPHVRDLLPNIVVLPTQYVDFGFPCAVVETVEQGAQRCFRFSQTLANFGLGALELRYAVDGIAEEQQIRQRIYRSDGSTRDRLADRYEFHAAHGHFHYKSFALSHLWQSDASGTKIGSEPVRTGRKNGFCIVDLQNHWEGTPESRERHYTEQDCQVPAVTALDSIELVQGITPGWSDIYDPGTEGQYIEVTGIPDGFYLVQTIADPDDTLQERSENDNDSWSLVQLCGESAQLYPPPPGAFDFCAQPAG